MPGKRASANAAPGPAGPQSSPVGPKPLLENKPLRLLLLAWLLATLLMLFFIKGEALFLKYPAVFGEGLQGYSRVLVNLVKEEATRQPAEQ